MLNIIIPLYKGKETLPKTLDSLVAQTKNLFWVTIVQDCDGENYREIIDEYKRRGLQITLLTTKVNSGPGMARQLGIDSSEMFDYVMFLDADDILMPRAVEILYHEAKQNDADVISSNFWVEQPNSMCIYLDVHKTPVTWCHGKIYKLKYLKQNNIRFIPELRLNEDSYFNLVALNSTAKKYKLEEVTYLWRDNKNSLTRSVSEIEFFKKSCTQYLLSQIKGLEKLDKTGVDITPTLIAATLLNIFRHYSKAKYFQLDLEDIDIQLKSLTDIHIVQINLANEYFWDYIEKHLIGCERIEDHLIFYKTPFSEWLKDILKGE